MCFADVANMRQMCRWCNDRDCETELVAACLAVTRPFEHSGSAVVLRAAATWTSLCRRWALCSHFVNLLTEVDGMTGFAKY